VARPLEATSQRVRRGPSRHHSRCYERRKLGTHCEDSLEVGTLIYRDVAKSSDLVRNWAQGSDDGWQKCHAGSSGMVTGSMRVRELALCRVPRCLGAEVRSWYMRLELECES